MIRPELLIFSHPLESAPLFGSTTVLRKVYNYTDVNFEMERMGGFGSFSAVIKGDEDVRKGDKVAVFNGLTCLYYGSILDIKEDPNGVVSLSGNNDILDSYFFDHDIPNGVDQREAFCIIRAEISRLLDPTSGFYDTVEDNLFNSITPEIYISTISAKGKSIRDVLNDFALKTNVKFTYKLTMTSAFKLRVVFSPIDVLSPQGYSLEAAVSYSLNQSGEVIPSVIIGTGSPRYKNAISNGTFEVGEQNDEVIFSELDYPLQINAPGGLYLDSVGGAESGNNPSTLTINIGGGASLKSVGADGDTTLPYENNAVYEIDNLGEFVSHTQSVAHCFPAKVGVKYTLACRATGEVLISSSSGVTVRVQIEFLNSAGTVLASSATDTTIDTRGYRLLKCSSNPAPVNTSRIRTTISLVSGTLAGVNSGVHIDKIRLFRKGKYYANGWQATKPGTASASTKLIDYEFRPTYLADQSEWKTRRGGGGFYFNTFVNPVNSNNYITLFRPNNPMVLTPGTDMRWMIHLSAWRGQVSNFPAALRVRVLFYKNDGSFLSQYVSPTISIVPAVSGFSMTTNTFSVPINTAYSHFLFEIMGTGVGVIDDISVRDVRETSIEYYDDEIKIARNAGSLIATAPYTNYIASYGKTPVTISTTGETVQEVEDYLKAWLDSQVTDYLSPEIVDQVREDDDLVCLFEKGARVQELAKIFPLEKVSFSISETDITRTSYLQTRPKSLDEFIVGVQNNSSKFAI